MAYGIANVPGIGESDLAEIREMAQSAKDIAEAAAEAVTKFTNTINVAPSQSGSLTYNGNLLSPIWNGYDPNAMEIGGIQNGTDAGTYSVTFTPKEGYQWADGTTEAKTVTWTIGRATISLPVQSGSLTYTGSAQSPEWSGYDNEKMTIGGAEEGTNAGSYSATFTPKDNYQWSDGSVDAKPASWRIGKAEGSLSLNKSSLTLTAASMSGTVVATHEGDGVVSATSSNTSIATVSVSANTVTVNAVAAGTVTVTVKVAAGSNHSAPRNETFSVTVNLPNKTLANNSPEMIQQAAQSGQAANYWSVGDRIGIKLNGVVGVLNLNSTYYAIILGFNHNASVEGNKSIHFQFGKNASGTDIAFTDEGYGNVYANNASARFVMNTTNVNTGGWKSSHMRQTLCEEFFSALPEAWRDVISPCVKYSDNTGGGNDTASYVTPTTDKVWLLSEFEVFGTRYIANSAEKNYQKQYDYYKNGNSKVRHKHNDSSTAVHWWLRSVYCSGTYYFCYVHTGGSDSHSNAHYSWGFAPGFKVA